MKYLVAVSGGIDSVVLLDKLVREAEYDITIAHFDHGIRTDSRDDARFVEGLARYYHLPFVSRREELGSNASEETARRRRYAFLREEARARDAVIVTAHHQDDGIETIAINVLRGTGWRGLAVLSAADIVRPLLKMSKAEIREYALQRRLEWVEDSTNTSDTYLRNRIRRRVPNLRSVERNTLLSLWSRQRELKVLIEAEAARFIDNDELNRYLFIHCDEASAKELLRAVFIRQGLEPPTRPQLERALLAIKTAKGSTFYDVGGKVSLRFTARTFIVTTP